MFSVKVLDKYPATLDKDTLYYFNKGTSDEFTLLTGNDGEIIAYCNENPIFDTEFTTLSLDGKVDKIAGKGLSTNDFNNLLKSKLENIQENATANQTDSHILSRQSHTSAQPMTTIVGLETEMSTMLNVRVGRFAEDLPTAKAIMNEVPDQKKIFDSWYRFSHNASGVYPALPDEILAWSYNSADNSINNTTNSVAPIGIISNRSFSEYELLANVSSNNNDDDVIGLVIAFHKEPDTGREHTLSVVRTPGGSGILYGIVYNIGQGTGTYGQQNLVVGSRLVTWGNNAAGNLNKTQAGYINNNPGWGNMGAFQKTGINGCALKVVRKGNKITTWTSQWSNPSVLDETTKIEFDLTSFSQLSVFIGAKPYGLLSSSQANSRWDIVTFSNPQDSVYDLKNKTIYVNNGTSWVPSTADFHSQIPDNTLLTDPITGKVFLKQKGSLIYKLPTTIVKE